MPQATKLLLSAAPDMVIGNQEMTGFADQDTSVTRKVDLEDKGNSNKIQKSNLAVQKAATASSKEPVTGVGVQNPVAAPRAPRNRKAKVRVAAAAAAATKSEDDAMGLASNSPQQTETIACDSEGETQDVYTKMSVDQIRSLSCDKGQNL